MQEHLERGAFLLFLASVSILFVTLLWPFFTPILWAVVFAILFYPFSEWLTQKTGGRRLLAVAITLLCVLVFVCVALFGLGALLVDEAINLYGRLSSQEVNDYLLRIEESTLVRDALSLFNVQEGGLRAHVVEIGQTGASWLASQTFAIGSNAASFVLKLFVMLYLTFVLLRSGGEIGERLMNTLPLERRKTAFLFDRFARTVHALFRGTLIVALAQGTVGGFLFYVAGVPDAFLWGVIMSLFALVPAVGPSIIWLPAGLILLALGNMVGALIILLGGVFLVGLLDNFLRPLLIGRDLEMSDALVMLSILSGLLAFGPSGLVIGPVIAAIFLSGWSLFEREYRAN